MIGILIIAHETLGSSLITCAEHMLGEQPEQLQTLAVSGEHDPEALLQAAQRLVQSLDTGDGVLVLSDIFGGTPCNIAMKLTSMDNVEGVSGLNFPMLITALNYRHLPIEACLDKTINNGQESIVHFNETGYVSL